MFTGIVEAVGAVVSVGEREDGRALEIEAPAGFLEDVDMGGSVSVDGACLTAVSFPQGRLRVDVIGTTASRTVAGRYREGDRVNLERALRVGDRLEGHWVQGHVDGVGELTSQEFERDTGLLRFRIPTEVHDLTIPYGSIAVNGVSLTVNRLLEGSEVEVGIIPHTWKHTNLGDLKPGNPVNVEGDLIGKYVGKLWARRGGGEPEEG